MTAAEHPTTAPWQDTTRSAGERARSLIAEMTTAEKVSQLYGLWVGLDGTGDGVAPFQHDFSAPELDWAAVIADGLGQLTRPFGTRPVDPLAGAAGLARSQEQIVAANRFGIPALVHEECLTGLTAWQATIYPCPLAWGATFDPRLAEQIGARIGASMKALGVHQGMAPVLDVARDLRWGRVEETIGEDPLLVGTIGAAYVRGVQSAGVIATLKHFVGYSASRAGRNLAPVSLGPRERADVLLPPFEMALRAGARSVMNAYTDVDGVPSAADTTLLTGLLRDALGFTGTVVADYFAVAFLQSLHHIAGDTGGAAALALRAGIDVELPSVHCYGQPLLDGLAAGAIDEALVDRALLRVLTQKAELGLLDPGWSASPEAVRSGQVDLDDAESRALARTVAERSLVLLQNDGVLPLAPGRTIALVGPRSDESSAMLGCYSFPMHVGAHHPDVPVGVEIPTLLEALTTAYDGDVHFARGCGVLDGSDDEIAAAVSAARDADVCVVALGDLAGLFGRGTSGEGCDVADLRLPGRQAELLEAVLATGTPVVAALLVGRPYDISSYADRLAAIVVGFFPGEEGGPALAGVLTGAVNPAGRLPVSFPGTGSSQPSTYLAATLGRRSEVSSIDPTPLFAFGHGLSYAPVTWGAITCATGDSWTSDGGCTVRVELRNTSGRDSHEVVQVYLHDLVAEVVRPVQLLIGLASVAVPAGSTRIVDITLHADQTSYTGLDAHRLVEPGAVELWVGASSTDIRAVLPVTVTGPRRTVGADRVLEATVTVT